MLVRTHFSCLAIKYDNQAWNALESERSHPASSFTYNWYITIPHNLTRFREEIISCYLITLSSNLIHTASTDSHITCDHWVACSDVQIRSL